MSNILLLSGLQFDHRDASGLAEEAISLLRGAEKKRLIV
jgi:hypothetical protein